MKRLKSQNFLFLHLFLLFILLAPPLQAEVQSEISFIDTNSIHLNGWKKQLFEAETKYQKKQIQGQWVIEANSRGSASGLYREVTIDLKQFPYLSWHWLVEKHPKAKNQHMKDGDDFAARIYVVVKDGFFPWQTKAINYVWSKQVEKGTAWPNPFLSNAIMVSTSNESDGINQWRSITVNVYEDLQRFHHKTFTKIDGIAIMTDSDNSKSSAIAKYRNIRFSRKQPIRLKSKLSKTSNVRSEFHPRSKR